MMLSRLEFTMALQSPLRKRMVGRCVDSGWERRQEEKPKRQDGISKWIENDTI